MKSMITKFDAICRKAFAFVNAHQTLMMFAGGLGLLAAGLVKASFAAPGDSFNDDSIRSAGTAILADLIEGSFGALIMVIAGLVAIISAAMGAYRAAMAALIVAVGAFVLRSFVTLFFGDVFV